MIRMMSLNIGEMIGRQLAYERSQIEVLAYGTQLLLETLTKVILVAVISILLGVFTPTMIVFASYAVFRSLGGGVHLSTFPRCLSIGVVMILGLGGVSTTILHQWLFFPLFFLTGFLLVICILLWIPAGTEKKTIKDPIVRKKQKYKVGGILILWAMMVLFLQQNSQLILSQALIYGALAALVFITPAGYKIMSSLDLQLDKLLGKEV